MFESELGTLRTGTLVVAEVSFMNGFGFCDRRTRLPLKLKNLLNFM